MSAAKKPQDAQMRRFYEGLACATLEPGLRSLLLFDAGPAELSVVSQILASMLETITGKTTMRIVLGSEENEDDLWGRLTLQIIQDSPQVGWKPGRLVPTSDVDGPILVEIPDLSSLSVASRRACVALMDSELAALQRHDQDLHWQPNYCWVAGCPHDEVGEVSPHLLDRIVLRLAVPSIATPDPFHRLEYLLMGEEDRVQTPGADVLAGINASLSRAALEWPQYSDESLAWVQAHFQKDGESSMRRPLALSRMARGIARLRFQNFVSRTHVDYAADLIGLSRPQAADTPPENGHESTQDQELSSPKPRRERRESIGPSKIVSEDDKTFTETPVYAPSSETVLPSASIHVPYPEDRADVLRESESLRLPVGHRWAFRVESGPIIGTRPATDLQDIALVATMLEAAKFSKVRPSLHGSQARFRILRSDFCSYRRLPAARFSLVMVLDYTCLQDIDWQAALLPHLTWAYTSRAAISVIQVGSSKLGYALRARQIDALNLLSPHLNGVFVEQRGAATPLAHGLDLAARRLRSVLQHGRNRSEQARLVVLTDGRGNVPLSSSRSGKVDQRITNEGIIDAIDVAKEIREFDRIQSVLLNPQPQQYSDLPIVLAETMGAFVEPVAIKLQQHA